MKVTCTQENLIKGLNKVAHIAGKNVSLPILNNILLRAKDGKFYLISTNLDIGIKSKVRGKVEKDGEITVGAKILFDYINLLPEGNVEIGLLKDSLEIVSGDQKTVIKGQSSEDFPVVPEVGGGDSVKIPTNKLVVNLSKVVFSASYDDIRPEMSGVYLNWSASEGAVFVATDSYRLSESVDTLSGGPKSDIDAILPLRLVQELVRILKDYEGNEVSMSFDEGKVSFIVEDTVIISRLIEGNYPNYKEIIPNSGKTRVVLNKDDVVKTLKVIGLFSRSGIYDVVIEINKTKNEVVFAATNIQVGESRKKIKADIQGENNTLVLNYKYLIDGLNAIKDKEFEFIINSADEPVVLKGVGDKRYLYLIMPIRK